MITMGLDCSTTCTGWSIFEDDKLIKYGCIKPRGADWRERLINEKDPLVELIDAYHPQRVYMENVPLVNKQMETLVILGAVQGYIMGIMAAYNIPITFLMPTEWRSAVGTYDGTRAGMKRDAQKEKAIRMANDKFGLDLKWVKAGSTKNEDDTAEAILICYSQVKRRGFGKPKSQK